MGTSTSHSSARLVAYQIEMGTRRLGIPRRQTNSLFLPVVVLGRRGKGFRRSPDRILLRSICRRQTLCEWLSSSSTRLDIHGPFGLCRYQSTDVSTSPSARLPCLL